MGLMEQFALPLDWPEGAAARLIVSASNGGAIAAIGRWQGWHGLTGILTGPPRSGKTLLADWFRARTGGQAIDDADRAGDGALFHAWNRAQEAGRPLLLTSRFMPADWTIDLPDLRSRVGSAELLALGPPDDELAAGLLELHLERLGRRAGAEAIGYALRRMPRGHAQIERFAERAAAAQGAGKPIGIAAMRAALGMQP